MFKNTYNKHNDEMKMASLQIFCVMVLCEAPRAETDIAV